jgi:biopolymer transport protein ExbD
MAPARRGPEIDVTPLIDILPVLLVIFLITIPRLIRFEEVQVPRHDDHVEGMPHLIVRVHADLSVVLVDDDREISLSASQMSAGLRAHLRDTTHAVFVELDDALPWSDVVSTIDAIRGAAPATQVALKVPE